MVERETGWGLDNSVGSNHNFFTKNSQDSFLQWLVVIVRNPNAAVRDAEPVWALGQVLVRTHRLSLARTF